ncbi:MAG: deoxynucleoside kinase [Lachnospiraceae bacterium]|nr:deoxynucleoside kinase [Lachnospiraceae bacterium]
MKKINYFIEGLQGAGKSTFVQRLSEQLPDHKVFREGDYSPVELAWCTYTTEEQYDKILADYPSLASEIIEKTVTEGAHRVICYTQILTEIPDFHRNLEKFEIYNGNLDRDAFEQVILERFGRWSGEGQIFECSIFQNIIENQMLYLLMDDDGILDFYRKLKRVLAGKHFQIVYLDVDDIEGTIDVIRKERSDERGVELWFPMMIRFLEEAPYGKAHGLTGMEGLVAHLTRRRALEHRILEEIFAENSIIAASKNYDINDIVQGKKPERA